MQNTKTMYIPVGQAIKTGENTIKVKTFLRKNKTMLVVSALAISLLSIYAFLLLQFIQLLKMI